MNSIESKLDNEAMAYSIITGNSDTVSNKLPLCSCLVINIFVIDESFHTVKLHHSDSLI